MYKPFPVHLQVHDPGRGGLRLCPSNRHRQMLASSGNMPVSITHRRPRKDSSMSTCRASCAAQLPDRAFTGSRQRACQQQINRSRRPPSCRAHDNRPHRQRPSETLEGCRGSVPTRCAVAYWTSVAEATNAVICPISSASHATEGKSPLPPAGPKLSPSVATPPNTASRVILVYIQQEVDLGPACRWQRATIDRYAGRLNQVWMRNPARSALDATASWCVGSSRWRQSFGWDQRALPRCITTAEDSRPITSIHGRHNG
jgi:hypothetical protein